jgi:DNA-binding transcriptional LysR family regulator
MVVAAVAICINAVLMVWNDLRYLLALARAGTFAGAARRLDVNQTTIARRLNAMETALGTQLFTRSEGSLALTKAGEAALEHAARIEREVEALEQGIGEADQAVAGTVRLTAVPILINRVLIPAVPALSREHPLLRLELIAEPRNLNLTRREADIAIRLARPEAGAALTRRMGYLDYAVYGPIGQSSDSLPWITYEEGLSHLPQARFVEKAMRSGADGALVAVSDAEGLLQAVHAGVGKAVLPRLVADSEPSLRNLSGRTPVLSREIWLMTHRELSHDPRIRAVIAWLEATLRTARRRGRQGDGRPMRRKRR